MQTLQHDTTTPTTTPLLPTLVYESTGHKLFALIIPGETVL